LLGINLTVVDEAPQIVKPPADLVADLSTHIFLLFVQEHRLVPRLCDDQELLLMELSHFLLKIDDALVSFDLSQVRLNFLVDRVVNQLLEHVLHTLGHVVPVCVMHGVV
jgi:hypothetical protein